MNKELKLKDLNVAIFESRHSKTMGDLVALHGGIPVLAPSMKEIPVEDNKECFVFAEKLFRGQIDILILLTGVGTRALMTILETKYSKEQVLAALKKIPLIPRGPKPIRVLKEWGISYAVEVPEPNTWKELVGAIHEWPLQGKTVAVQEYGISNPELTQALEARGARVYPVPVYKWALPDDLEPLKQTISKTIAGQIHAALFTTSIQVDHVLEVAKSLKVEAVFRSAMRKVVIGSVGPDCSETLTSRGFLVDLEPQSPKMGPLVQLLADKCKELLTKKR